MIAHVGQKMFDSTEQEGAEAAPLRIHGVDASARQQSGEEFLGQIARRFFILDEAQQLPPHEVKTVITRISEGSKIILIGDPAQIDDAWGLAEHIAAAQAELLAAVAQPAPVA